MMNPQTKSNARLIVYGHDYCAHAHMLVTALQRHQVNYEWRDVMHGELHFQDELKELTNGYLSVPIVIFPDGVVMIEPWSSKVLQKLGLKQAGWLEKLLQKWWER